MANFNVDTTGNLWIGTNVSDTFSTAQGQTATKFYVENDGTIKAEAGTIGGIDLATDHIKSSNYSATQGFRLNSDGSAIFRNITISGYATTTQVNNAQSTADSAATSASNAQSTADSASSTASSAESTANTANSTANSVNGTVGSLQSNLFYGGTTEINGGTIRTGTLSADKITTGTLDADRIESNAGFTGSVTASLSLNAPSVSGTTATFSTVDAYTHRIRGTSSTITGGSDIRLNPSGTNRLTVSSTITADATIRPNGNNTNDLGSSLRRWRDIYTFGSVNTSDINFKTDVEDLELGLDFLNTLNPIQFKWAATEDVDAGVRTHTGFSAQDIEQKLIDFGVESKDYALFTNSQITEFPEEDPIYGLRSNELISVLTKAVQELSTQVSDLTARIETLEG